MIHARAKDEMRAARGSGVRRRTEPQLDERRHALRVLHLPEVALLRALLCRLQDGLARRDAEDALGEVAIARDEHLTQPVGRLGHTSFGEREAVDGDAVAALAAAALAPAAEEHPEEALLPAGAAHHLHRGGGRRKELVQRLGLLLLRRRLRIRGGAGLLLLLLLLLLAARRIHRRRWHAHCGVGIVGDVLAQHPLPAGPASSARDFREAAALAEAEGPAALGPADVSSGRQLLQELWQPLQPHPAVVVCLLEMLGEDVCLRRDGASLEEEMQRLLRHRPAVRPVVVDEEVAVLSAAAADAEPLSAIILEVEALVSERPLCGARVAGSFYLLIGALSVCVSSMLQEIYSSAAPINPRERRAPQQQRGRLSHREQSQPAGLYLR